MTVLFDTLKLAQRLEAAGMGTSQAQGTAAAIAESMTATVATAQDLQVAVTELRGEIHEVEARLRTEIAGLRAEVRGWLVTQAFAIIGAVAAIIGLAAALSRLIH